MALSLHKYHFAKAWATHPKPLSDSRENWRADTHEAKQLDSAAGIVAAPGLWHEKSGHVAGMVDEMRLSVPTPRATYLQPSQPVETYETS